MRPATLLGVPVVVNLTWLLVFALLIISLVTSIAGTGPAALPGASTLGVSAVVVILFLGSIVLHELAHAAVGARRGVPPRQIRLLAIGRSSDLDADADPTSPLTEILVAAAGPTVSLVLAGILLLSALAFPADTTEPLSWLYWTIYWLGLANLALAVFHLVPVLPLDGGRLVRALAWRISSDLDQATRWTSLVGRAFGYAVVAGGLFIAMFVEVFVGLWLVLLGWFASRLARGAVDHRRMERLTEGLTVDDVVDRDPATVTPNLTLDLLMEQDEADGGSGVYPVIEEGGLRGVVFLARLPRRSLRGRGERRVADVLVPADRAPSVSPGDPLIRAIERLEGLRLDGVPVIDRTESPRLAGLVTRGSVMGRLRARQAIVEERSRQASARRRG